ncbi:glutathione S-transferase 1 [Folsomia candida]|uniref:Glutathione S-transferase 1, isoform D n=1 Tax=Folsomia candida TaxID=158441 RepID=A0A226DFP1_FOLCA|nr:glutathione S-transferase 1 [Folsomia candida]XP_035714849.1 glutathione S-transferase 1 [Folsomia candida]XP_035714850.1 glutathione S-transferase 1 [Folsomia candida]OXA43391.1 Glutathione S-transferase 1, isoform D [Folsomia candida]
MGQCPSKSLDSIKTLDYPGKKFYLSHRNKIDTVADVIITKEGEGGAGGGAENNATRQPSSRSSFKGSGGGKKVAIAMGLKLYHISDSPPCLAVRMALAYLGLQVELVDIDFLKAEQASELYKKKNPQGEVPLLDDNGFLLSESVAILQYLAEKYKVDEKFYPSADPQARAVINHRLSFHLSTYYKAMADYVLLPICYAYTRSEPNLKKVNHALTVFQELLGRQDGNYAAGADLTIADLPLFVGTLLLQVIDFDLSPYPGVKSWYAAIQSGHPDLYAIAEKGLAELKEFEKNPPDLSQISHPIHPTDRKKQPDPEVTDKPEVTEMMPPPQPEVVEATPVVVQPAEIEPSSETIEPAPE